MPRDEAAKLLKIQIDKGQNLHGTPITTEQQYQSKKSAYKKWSNFNHELVSQMEEHESLIWDYTGYAVEATNTYSSPPLNILVSKLQRNINEK